MTLPIDMLPFESEARAALGEPLYRYLIAAPDDLADANAEDLKRFSLVPRVLTGAGAPDISLTAFGRCFKAPLAVGAFAGDRVFHEEGLLPIARVCARLGLPLVISEETVTPLAEITAHHDACWLQLRAAGPVERILELLDMAVDAGAMGLVLTVFAPVHPVPGFQPGGFSIGDEIARRGWSTIGSKGPGVEPLPAFPAWTWDEIDTVCEAATARGLPLLLKGILHPDDAATAAEVGIAGIVASNIGLRQSRRWAPVPGRLPALKRASARPLALDGGVRSGADVIVARCLGADFSVAVRPIVTALVGGGEAGLETLLGNWVDEIFALTAWLGAGSLADLGPDHLTIMGDDE